MTKAEINKEFRRRNKARNNVKKCKDALWKCKGSDRPKYIKRLKEADEEMDSCTPDFLRALRGVLGGE